MQDTDEALNGIPVFSPVALQGFLVGAGSGTIWTEYGVVRKRGGRCQWSRRATARSVGWHTSVGELGDTGDTPTTRERRRRRADRKIERLGFAGCWRGVGNVDTVGDYSLRGLSPQQRTRGQDVFQDVGAKRDGVYIAPRVIAIDVPKAPIAMLIG